MSRRKKKGKKKQKQRPRRPPGRLTQGLPGDFLVVEPPAGTRKMSEVLWDFLQPYVDTLRDDEALQKLLNLGIIAWNAAIVTGSKRDELIEGLMESVEPELRPGMRTILDEMIRRKDALFATNKRFILSLDLTMRPSGPYLQVVSTFDTP
jgi:hypothetical protein